MTIEKTYTYEGSILKIKYDGNLKYVIENQNDLKKQIDNFFENNKIIDLATTIEIIRTVLSDYNEKYLEIWITKNKNINYVRFYGGTLVQYKNSIEINEEDKNGDILKTSYDYCEGLKFSITNKSINITKMSRSTNKMINTSINKEINNISKLSNIKPSECSKETISKSLKLTNNISKKYI